MEWTDEKHGGSNESEIMATGAVSRRDMATQMSSAGGSPKEKLSPDHPTLNPTCNFSSKVEIRDVQVDKGATMTRQSREDGVSVTKKASPETKELALPWDLAEASKNRSRYVQFSIRVPLHDPSLECNFCKVSQLNYSPFKALHSIMNSFINNFNDILFDHFKEVVTMIYLWIPTSRIGCHLPLLSFFLVHFYI